MNFLGDLSEEDVGRARADIKEWLGDVAGKDVIDIGSGSGLHSLCFKTLGARRLVSFDYDPKSVQATRTLKERTPENDNWTVLHGSILDRPFVDSLGKFDVVYSWGVLHHTGAMWEAIENAAGMVAPGGIFWIALYQAGPRYEKDLALKQRYNRASKLGKWWMVQVEILIEMLRQIRHGKNPLFWNQQRHRGMNQYHDIIDWLGGLPYEVADEDETVVFGRKKGFILERIKVKDEGACSIYVFSRPA